MTANIYLGGFLFGVLFAIFYNDFAYLMIILLRQKDIKISFYFDVSQKLNIIKSPIEAELGEHWNKQKEKDKDRLIDCYKLEHIPTHPYTIAFVANPGIRKEPKSTTFRRDPIIDDRRLFLRAVDDALQSFQSNEVLGHRDIWPKVRVVALFDDDVDDDDLPSVALTQPYEHGVVIDDAIQAENIIEPMDNYFDTYKSMIDNIKESGILADEISGSNIITPVETDDTDINKNKSYVDVIFLISASPTYTRPTCFPGMLTVKPKDEDGQKFCFTPNVPFPHENTYQCTDAISEANEIMTVHEYFINKPGVAAINVLAASSRTYIHEFGHAMACPRTGAIVDEYFDSYELFETPTKTTEPTPLSLPELNNPSFTPPFLLPWDKLKDILENLFDWFADFPSLFDGPEEGNEFYINRLERVDPSSTKIMRPIPRVFAMYNGSIYESDLKHPSANSNWTGFFPERQDINLTCIMDGYGARYQFDDLLSQFMYDRLYAKVNRDYLQVSP